MLMINGKFGFAKVMIDEIDDTTREQIQEIVNQPMYKGANIVIMPDCHKGSGCVIGFTRKIEQYLIPNEVGVDIGCGLLAYNLGNIEIDLSKLDAFIKSNIPSGMNHRTEIHPLLRTERFQNDNEILNSLIFESDFDEVCLETNQDRIKVLKQAGTLGGGNHFQEVGVDEQGNKWLFIHSGSRNFGKRIADFYQEKAKELCDAYFVDIPKGMEFLHKSSPAFSGYLKAMKCAQKLASINRKLMAYDVIHNFLGIQDIEKLTCIESVHNYIDMDKGFVRKGAISAELGQDCIIPFNMRDGVILCKGKGNSAYNFSAPHGAGRILSRSQANKELNGEAVDKEMKDNGIYTSTAKFAVDEAPQAYKDKDIILKNIATTVEVVNWVKPIYNFKAQEEPKKWKKNKV